MLANPARFVRHSRRANGGSGGAVGAIVTISRHEALVILVGIDAKPALLDNADLDGVSEGEDAQLLQFLQLLQRFRRQGGQAQQKGPAIGVETDMQKEPPRPPREIGLAIADVGDGTAAEIEGAAGGIANDLDAVGILPLIQRAQRRGQCGHVRAGMLNQ